MFCRYAKPFSRIGRILSNLAVHRLTCHSYCTPTLPTNFSHGVEHSETEPRCLYIEGSRERAPPSPVYSRGCSMAESLGLVQTLVKAWTIGAINVSQPRANRKIFRLNSIIHLSRLILWEIWERVSLEPRENVSSDICPTSMFVGNWEGGKFNLNQAPDK